MATYVLQRVASGFIPVSAGFNDTGVFTLGFPVSSDSNMPSPYQPAVGDQIQLGWIPKGFTVYQAWTDAAMSSTGTSTWFLGDLGPSNLIIGSDITIGGQNSRYYFLIGSPAVFYGPSEFVGLTTQAIVAITCAGAVGNGNFSGNVFLRGSMDFANSTLSPTYGGVANNAMGIPQV